MFHRNIEITGPFWRPRGRIDLDCFEGIRVYFTITMNVVNKDEGSEKILDICGYAPAKFLNYKRTLIHVFLNFTHKTMKNFRLPSDLKNVCVPIYSITLAHPVLVYIRT